jgi:hypothetical protein
MFIFSKHAASNQVVTCDDEGVAAAWMYLTDSEGRVISDVWLYNLRGASDDAHAEARAKRQPPPAPVSAIDPRHYRLWDLADTEFMWLPTGQGVALVVEGRARAVLLTSSRRGCNLALKTSCPWGEPLDSEAFMGLFECAPEMIPKELLVPACVDQT